MKKNKYKNKKWVLMPIFILMCSLILGFGLSKPVNAYVDYQEITSRSGSLFPNSVYIENKKSQYDNGYTFYPFDNSSQLFLNQNTDGVADPIVSDDIVYDNYNFSHRIVANTRTQIYGLDNFYYNYNRFNPFVYENNLFFTGMEYIINGAQGSSKKLGGALENIALNNIKIMLEFGNFNIPISFLTNPTYSTSTDYSDLFVDPTEQYSIIETFSVLNVLRDSDLQISPYSICGLYDFGFDIFEGGFVVPVIERLDISIDWLNTAVYGTPFDIGIHNTEFSYYYSEEYAYTPYISVPDILHYFITNVLDTTIFGSSSWVYVQNMTIDVIYPENSSSEQIQNIRMNSIFTTESYTADSPQPGIFFGDNWYSILNGGQIGGNVDYEIDFSSWLITAVGGFMNAELFPGFAIGGIFAVMVAFPLVIWFLKLVLGG